MKKCTVTPPTARSHLSQNLHKVIPLVSVVLLVACAVSGNPLGLLKDSRDLEDALILQNKEVSADYEPLGCYKYKAMRNEKRLKRFKDASRASLVCIQSAEKNNCFLFGIIKKKRKIQCVCLTGYETNHQLSAKWCKGKIGKIKRKRKTIYIYRKSQKPGSTPQCTFGNKSYSEGDQAEMYHPNDDIYNSFCKTCECSGGEFRDCNTYFCDIGLQNCKEIHHPNNTCCPECKYYSCGEKKEGEEWFERGKSWNESKEDCSRCVCLPGNTKFCEKIYGCIKPECENPVIPEGKCCPECDKEVVTTSGPTFTIAIPTGTPTTEWFPWNR